MNRIVHAPSASVLSRTPSRAYRDRVVQLSQNSVTKHFDAYADIDWNRRDHRIDPGDPRWQKGHDDPLGRTEWYQSQPEATRARIGLHHIATQMKIGIDFEAVLARGLLDFAARLPNGAPEFRYAYHEIIEEGQHSLMFQEFVNRAGLPVHGLTGFNAFVSRFVPRLGYAFPELFFLFVLGGEAPIDDIQRRALATQTLHPLLRRVMRIHVTEEARHLCFAKAYLSEHVPRLNTMKRFQLKLRTPIVLATMAEAMLKPPAALIRRYAVPRSVVRQAYESPLHREQILASLAPIRSLCHELGLITPAFSAVWRRLGIAPPAAPRRARLLHAPIRALPGDGAARDGDR